ncbi:hypothetical protein ILYODFUR_036306 [Ilyodon furcidens]|uniref:Uncharacterized protein n=1 Tax=Ilyodon furcidens TaxID=33524 RepID=A0ABV0TPR8_9TELE
MSGLLLVSAKMQTGGTIVTRGDIFWTGRPVGKNCPEGSTMTCWSSPRQSSKAGQRLCATETESSKTNYVQYKYVSICSLTKGKPEHKTISFCLFQEDTLVDKSFVYVHI